MAWAARRFYRWVHSTKHKNTIAFLESGTQHLRHPAFTSILSNNKAVPNSFHFQVLPRLLASRFWNSMMCGPLYILMQSPWSGNLITILQQICLQAMWHPFRLLQPKFSPQRNAIHKNKNSFHHRCMLHFIFPQSEHLCMLVNTNLWSSWWSSLLSELHRNHSNRSFVLVAQQEVTKLSYLMHCRSRRATATKQKQAASSKEAIPNKPDRKTSKKQITRPRNDNWTNRESCYAKIQAKTELAMFQNVSCRKHWIKYTFMFQLEQKGSMKTKHQTMASSKKMASSTSCHFLGTQSLHAC